MNDGLEVDDQDIYANESIQKLTNVSELLKTRSLDELLPEDKEAVNLDSEEVSWYHGKISRETAENILQEGLLKQGDINGLFLIRDSTASDTDFSLSLTCRSQIYHFQIKEKCEGFYHIDNGPVIHGLDRFVQHYSGGANGLPTCLVSFCKASVPPSKCREKAATNLLHRAVLEGKEKIVADILSHRLCPDVNDKNAWGSTALHDAAYHGFDEIVRSLLAHKADVKLKDKNGHTALHRACLNNQVTTAGILIRDGHASPTERCPLTGWSPLHEAAMRGHTACVKLLLDVSGSPFPRNEDKKTPLDLADQYNRLEVMRLYDTFQLPALNSVQGEWFHPELEREGSKALFTMHGMPDGLFIIRPSRHHRGWHVLSLCHQNTVYNYEVKNTDYRDKQVYYIDDGPYLLGLDHLVYHYSRYEDGLPNRLRTALSPSNQVRELPVPEDYYNLGSVPVPTQAYSSVNKVAPRLPPRPVESSSPEGKRRSHPSSPGSAPPVPSSAPPARTLQRTPSAQGPETEPEADTFKLIPSKHVKLEAELGQGEYGTVVKGHYNIREGLRTKKIQVAVKTLFESTVDNREVFLREARVMQNLNHPCIVRLLGVVSEEKNMMLVEEFMPMGSMLDYLLDHGDDVRISPDLYLWAAQIAAGMMYLEDRKLVHRDLAARNILLQSKKQAKISDFGLSRATRGDSEYYKATHGGRWPIKWYAPESVNYGQFSHASDVWSYGITLWEMFSYGEPPYGDKKGIEVIQFIEQGNRLQAPDQCPQHVYDMMLKCWSKDPQDRPTFKKLNEHFQECETYQDIKEIQEMRKQNRK